ncbi:MAG TPA: signal peptidase II [Candidatus Competibacteraceae bacterium]|nr:signal peptidase II [Candidatus Competibacteraceae bacterium]
MLRWLWLSALVVVLDQGSKWLAQSQLQLHRPVPVIDGFFNWFLAYNTGAAFSFLAAAGGWQRWFFLILAAAVSAGLVYWLARLKPGDGWLAAALALILGGALGNFIDRARLGHVVDFIQIYYDRWYWPAFNLADSAITVGAVMLLLDTLRSGRRAPVDSA